MLSPYTSLVCFLLRQTGGFIREKREREWERERENKNK
jgi:hypothetical protein